MRHIWRRVACCLPGLAAALLAGCAGDAGVADGSRGAPAEPPAQAARLTPLALPAPAGLLAQINAQPAARARQASTSFNEVDVQHDGGEFDPLLPLAAVAADGPGAVFSPSWDGSPAAGLNGVAYCTYHFDIPGYDRNPQLRLIWSTPPADYNACFVALANWDTNRWDWYQPGSNWRVELPAMDPYLGVGYDILVVVAVASSGETPDLGVLRVGGYPPQPALSATPTSGDIPLDFTLDASASVDAEYAIVKYEWDMDGDGVYDNDTGVLPSIGGIYGVNGSFHPTVRVTNEINARATAATQVEAIGYWTHTWGATQSDQLSDFVIDGESAIYAAGQMQRDTFDILLQKWSPTGELLWSRGFEGGDDEYIEALARCDNGDLVLVGNQADQTAGMQMLAQRWSSTGELLWSRNWGGSGYDRLDRVLVDGEDLYVAGQGVTGAGAGNLCLFKLTGTGSLSWGRYRDGGAEDRLTDIVFNWNILSGNTGVTLLGETTQGGDPNLWKVVYALNGDFSSGQQLGSSSQPKRYGRMLRVYSLIGGTTRYYISGTLDSGSGPELFISATDVSGAHLWATKVPGASPQVWDLAFDGTGSLLVAGFDSPAATNQAMLYQFQTADGAYLGGEAWIDPDGHARGLEVRSFRQGLLLAGFSRSSGGGWETAGFSGTALTLDFSAFNGAGGDPGWALEDYGGVVDNNTLVGIHDSGAGGDDCLLTYRPHL